jgi:hypothetical protein
MGRLGYTAEWGGLAARRPRPGGTRPREAPQRPSPRGPSGPGWRVGRSGGAGRVNPRVESGLGPVATPVSALRRPGRRQDLEAIPPEEAKLRAGERRRYRLCTPPPARYPEGADVVKVLVTRRGGRIKRLVLGSWPVSVPADARCVLPPWPRQCCLRRRGVRVGARAAPCLAAARQQAAGVEHGAQSAEGRAWGAPADARTLGPGARLAQPAAPPGAAGVPPRASLRRPPDDRARACRAAQHEQE